MPQGHPASEINKMLGTKSPLKSKEVRAALGNSFSYNVAEAVLGEITNILLEDEVQKEKKTNKDA